MARSDAQKRARAKYEKEKVKQVMVRFYPSENDILEFLESQFDYQSECHCSKTCLGLGEKVESLQAAKIADGSSVSVRFLVYSL